MWTTVHSGQSNSIGLLEFRLRFDYERFPFHIRRGRQHGEPQIVECLVAGQFSFFSFEYSERVSYGASGDVVYGPVG